MENKTKYNLHDRVFFLKDNRVCDGEIVKCAIYVDMQSPEKRKYEYDKSLLDIVIFYTIAYIPTEQKECQLFKSKEDLLKSL